MKTMTTINKPSMAVRMLEGCVKNVEKNTLFLGCVNKMKACVLHQLQQQDQDKLGKTFTDKSGFKYEENKFGVSF